jgi:hypothetical protein
VQPAAWLIGVAIFAASGAAAYPDGAPPGHTGGFDEPGCQQCHFSYDENPPGGKLWLRGVPSAYEPGRTYELELALRHPEVERAGFQLSARLLEEPGAGAAAGRLEPRDGRVQRQDADGVQYLGHTLDGSRTAPGRPEVWRMIWQAPDVDQGPVLFHVTGVAGNDDDSPFGDWVLARSLRTECCFTADE